jgi:ligand-binding sensor domain-containing protein
LHLTFYGQQPKIKFKRISIEHGLSNSTIENINQDKRGFMWFGTRDGLNRFDGYQMTVYRYHSKDSTTISDNYIRYIHNDREGNLWVGTINGLNRFVPDKNNFIRYKNNPAHSKSLSNNHITSIYEDRSGNLWIGTFGGGLNIYKKIEKTFSHFRHDPINSNGLSDDRVNCIYEDKAGNLWIGTEKGLNLFNRKTQNFRHQNLGDESPGATYVDSDRCQWPLFIQSCFKGF